MGRSLLQRIAPMLTIAGFLAISHPSAWAQTADVSITMTADRLKAKIGEFVVYDVLVTNLGPDDATGVSFNIVLGDQFDVASFTCEGTITPTTTICGVDTLASGASVESILVAKVVNTLSGPQGRLASVSATVSSSASDPDSANNTAEVRIKIIGPRTSK